MEIKTFSDLEAFISILDNDMPLLFLYHSERNILKIRYEQFSFYLNLDFHLTKSFLDFFIFKTSWVYCMLREGVCGGF